MNMYSTVVLIAQTHMYKNVAHTHTHTHIYIYILFFFFFFRVSSHSVAPMRTVLSGDLRVKFRCIWPSG